MPKGHNMFRHSGLEAELPGMSQAEVARYFGVTKMAICMAEKAAIRKLWRKPIIALREKGNGNGKSNNG